MLTKLSPAKEKVYNLYKKYIENNKVLTYKKAAKILDNHVSAIFRHVNDLIKLWYLQKRSDWSIILLDTSTTKIIPLLGKIACGSPLYIEEEHKTIEAPRNILKWTWNFYALVAEWESMVDAWILSWDYLVIKQQTDVDDWDIGVLIVKDDFDEYATLKQIFHTKSWVLAKPKNSKFKTFIISNKKAEIRWKLMWVIRNY